METPSGSLEVAGTTFSQSQFSRVASQSVVAATEYFASAAHAKAPQVGTSEADMSGNLASAAPFGCFLFLLHGKQFDSSCGIAQYGHEPILKLIAAHSRRIVYQVGAHIVMVPPAYFCSCSAFRYQSCNKHTSYYLCKHILAVQMAVGQSSGRILAGTVVGQQQAMHGGRLTDPSALNDAVMRERVISDEEFIEILSA